MESDRLLATGVALRCWPRVRGRAAGRRDSPQAAALRRARQDPPPISTDSADAQRFFDQGLALAFGFNHDGAIDAFREAARLQPKCAMCWWGIAFAYGPNINAPMGPEGAAAAWAAAQEAKRLASHASPAERDYIDAIQVRYVADPAQSAGAQRKALDEAFANAMRGVYQKHPDDADAAAIFAESLLDLSPWNYWQDDGSPRAFTNEAEAALKAGWR
jgi:hypothetical protein